jgi:putative superfamily III holin-X
MTQSPSIGARGAPPAHGAPALHDPPLKEVLAELWQNIEKLMRQEMKLASVELDVKAQRLKTELTALAIGAALMVAGALALVAAVILLLDLLMAAWLAALVTGGVAAGVGFALVNAKKPSARDVTPERTIENLGKDIQTLRESTK